MGVSDLPVQYMSNKSVSNSVSNFQPPDPSQPQAPKIPPSFDPNPDIVFPGKGRTQVTYDNDLFKAEKKPKNKKKRKSKTEKQNELLEAALNGPISTAETVGVGKLTLTSVKPVNTSSNE